MHAFNRLSQQNQWCGLLRLVQHQKDTIQLCIHFGCTWCAASGQFVVGKLHARSMQALFVTPRWCSGENVWWINWWVAGLNKCNPTAVAFRITFTALCTHGQKPGRARLSQIYKAPVQFKGPRLREGNSNSVSQFPLVSESSLNQVNCISNLEVV